MAIPDWPVPLPAGLHGLESGFAKILALGLSKLRAIEMHRHIPGIGLGAAIETSARRTIGGTELRIAGGLAIGSILFFIGLALVRPVLGHATWHLYRKLVPR